MGEEMIGPGSARVLYVEVFELDGSKLKIFFFSKGQTSTNQRVALVKRLLDVHQR